MAVLAIVNRAVVPHLGYYPLSFEEFLRPFEWVDFSATYARYAAMVDLFLYTLIFVGAAQVSLGRRYPGRGGRALSIGAGLALAVGMIVAEDRLGFNLKTFGPIAVVILLLLAGIILQQLLFFAGLERGRALAAAYILMFFILLGAAPGLFDWLKRMAPFLLGLMLMLLIGCIGMLIMPWGSFSHGDMGGRDRRQRIREVGPGPGRGWDRAANRGERSFIRRRVRPQARRLVRQGNQLSRDLGAIEKDLRRKKNDPRSLGRAAEQIDRLIPQAELLSREGVQMSQMQETLRRFDTQLLSRKDRERLTALSRGNRALLTQEIRDETSRERANERSINIEKAFARRGEEISRHLLTALTALKQGDRQTALVEIDRAKAVQQSIAKLLWLLLKFENYLQRLARRDGRIERKLLPP